MTRTDSTVYAAALAAAIVVNLCPTLVLGSCYGSQYRGCNAPMPYTTMVAANEYPVIHASAGFPANQKAAIEAGHKAAADFLGGVSNVSAFLWEMNGADDSVYANVKTAYCANGGLTDSSDCDERAKNYIDSAKNGIPKYAVEGGKSECCGGHNVNTRNGIYYTPSSTSSGMDDPTLSVLGAHEFTHVYQAMKGDYPPAWMMEGGAVHMQAMMAHKFPQSGGQVNTYRKAYEFAGGRSKPTIDATIFYYSTTVGKTQGLRHAEDRCCGDSCGIGLTQSQLPMDGAVYYDIGAVAIAFAIHRSNRTSADFWRNPNLGQGFWNAIPASTTTWDYLNGHASQVQEGQGWKKAFTAFTGYANMNDFYEAFNTWAKSATKADMIAILETDDAIKNQVAVNATISESKSSGMTASMKNEDGTCKSDQSQGSGGGSSSGSPEQGYTGTGTCNQASEECPAPFGPKFCTSESVKDDVRPPVAWRKKVYAAGVKLHGSNNWNTVVAIPAGEDWNQEAGFMTMPDKAERGCGTSCNDVYKKMILAYSPEGACWPKEKGIPILANKDTTDNQMMTCLEVLMHHLMPRPKYFKSSSEILDKILENNVIFNCGNNPKDSASGAGYPHLRKGDEGGGGTFYQPDTYGEQTGMCPGQKGETNSILSEGYKQGGERYGGHVAVEEFGHTVFDGAIAQVDPEGWLTVQKAESRAAQMGIHTRDSDWDCHTAATEYISHGVEILLYNTRVGPNHKATTVNELIEKDPYLFCLASRWYEVNNTFALCNDGPDKLKIPANAVNCLEVLKGAGTGITSTPGPFSRQGQWTPAMGCPVLPPKTPSAAKPSPPKSQSPADKLKSAKDKLDAAKKAATDKRKIADEKKAAANTKKAAAKAKIEELVKSVTNAKDKVKLKVIAGAKAAGKKIKKINTQVTAADETAACKDVCAKSKVDCDNEVLCEASAPNSGRHLLASSFMTSLYVNPDVTTVDATANLKAAGVSPTEAEMEPDLNMVQNLPGLSTEGFNALKTETEASAAAVKEAETAETTAKAAEADVTTAEKEVTDASALISPPPPLPPPAVVVESAAAGREFVLVVAAIFAGLAALLLVNA